MTDSTPRDPLDRTPDKRIKRALVEARVAYLNDDYDKLERCGREIRANAQRAQEESG